MRKIYVIFGLLLFLFSCKEEKKNQVDVSHIPVKINVLRFDIDFYNTTSKTLYLTKKKYPLLFPKNTPDSVWISKINNKEEQELFTETQKVYKNISKLKKQLQQLFKHVKYYNPTFNTPKIITLISNIDYQSRVIYADTLLLISLDVYLGKNHPFYADYPKYIKENNQKNHIVVDVANKLIEKQLLPNSDRTFIGKMIYEGKKMYLLDMYLPKVSDKEKIGYTQDKLDWAITNEEEIWKYFIEKKLLYSTDTKLNQRFLNNAPFSKFYLAHDNDSPGKLGSWIGWQIVRSYMQENNVSLSQLLQEKAIGILKKSKYKPRK